MNDLTTMEPFDDSQNVFPKLHKYENSEMFESRTLKNDPGLPSLTLHFPDQQEFDHFLNMAKQRGLPPEIYAFMRMGYRIGKHAEVCRSTQTWKWKPRFNQPKKAEQPTVRPFEVTTPGVKAVSYIYKVHTHCLDGVFRHTVAAGGVFDRAFTVFTVREYPDGRYGMRQDIDKPHRLHIYNMRGAWLCTVNRGQDFKGMAVDFHDALRTMKDRVYVKAGVRRLEQPKKWYNPEDIKTMQDFQDRQEERLRTDPNSPFRT